MMPASNNSSVHSSTNGVHVSFRICAFFILTAVVLLATNVRLVHLNRRLEQRAVNAEHSASRTLSIVAGRAAPPLNGYDINRQPVSIELGKEGVRTVIFSFSPRCPACDEIWPLWQNLIRTLSRDRFALVAVDTTQVVDDLYLNKHGLTSASVRTIASPSIESLVAYPLRLTPELILVDENRRVEHLWTGTPQGWTEADTEAFDRAFGSAAAEARSYLVSND